MLDAEALRVYFVDLGRAAELYAEEPVQVDLLKSNKLRAVSRSVITYLREVRRRSRCGDEFSEILVMY